MSTHSLDVFPALEIMKFVTVSKNIGVKCQKNTKPYYMLIVKHGQQAGEPSNSTAAASTLPTLNTGKSTLAGVSTDFSSLKKFNCSLSWLPNMEIIMSFED